MQTKRIETMAALAIIASLGQAAEMTVPLVVYANVELRIVSLAQFTHAWLQMRSSQSSVPGTSS